MELKVAVEKVNGLMETMRNFINDFVQGIKDAINGVVRLFHRMTRNAASISLPSSESLFDMRDGDRDMDEFLADLQYNLTGGHYVEAHLMEAFKVDGHAFRHMASMRPLVEYLLRVDRNMALLTPDVAVRVHARKLHAFAMVTRDEVLLKDRLPLQVVEGLRKIMEETEDVPDVLLEGTL